MGESSELMSFLHQCNKWIKLFKTSPWYDVFISNKLSLFLTVQQRLGANNCENTSFVQLEPQMILLNSVNPYLYSHKFHLSIILK